MKSLMKASFNILHDSPARWDDYESVTKCSKWSNIKQIINFWEKCPKSTKPSNKSYNTLETDVLDELVTGKLCFF